MNTQRYTVRIGRCVGLLLATMYFAGYVFNPGSWGLIDNVNLVIHEAGHTLLRFAGEFIMVAAGSGFQILFPMLFVLYFAISREWFSASLTLFWVGQNFISVSVYAHDAQAMLLPLLGGDGVMHDWNYLLSTSGLLAQTNTIGSILYGIGAFVIMIAILLSLRFCIEKVPSSNLNLSE